MIESRFSMVFLALALLPQASGAADAFHIGACRGVACDTIQPASESSLIEVRGSAPADAGRMLDLTVYNAASYEIAYYDTVEAPPSGDFAFRIPLRSLRPGSYTFSVVPRYSGATLGVGSLTAAGLVPATPAWAPQVAEEYRRY